MKFSLYNIEDRFNSKVELGMTLKVESVNRATGEVKIENDCETELEGNTKLFMQLSYLLGGKKAAAIIQAMNEGLL